MLSATISAVARRCSRAPGPLSTIPSAAKLSLEGGGLSAASRTGVPALLCHAPGGSRAFYFPRKNWWPWRSRIMHQRQAAVRKKRHIWPRQVDKSENPIFGDKYDGTHVQFREKELRIGLKTMVDYARMIRGRQMQDAIDWVESMARMNTEPIIKFLKKSLQECVGKRGMDPARVYILEVHPQRGKYVKELKKHARANYGVVRRPRNGLLIKVRQLPIEEYFHKVYIWNKVPRSLASDMRLALHQSRVSPQMQKEWAPYLCANSRMFHRKELKWLDKTRQFDYYEVRREWIARYKANLLRASAEAREARGLAPLPAAAD